MVESLLACVDSGAVDTVLPKTPCKEYLLKKTTRSRSGVGFKGVNGSHIVHHGQRPFHVQTSAESIANIAWENADVLMPLISANPLVERRHKLVLHEHPRTPCMSDDVLTLERFSSLFLVRLWIPDSFPRQG